jgi:hypothetical protein
MRAPQDLHEAAAVNRKIIGIEGPRGSLFKGITAGHRFSDKPAFGPQGDRPGFPPQDRRGQLDGLEDLLVAGAAAQMGLESGFNLLPDGPGIFIEQGPGAEDDSGRAEAALNRPGLGEG